MTVDDLGPSVLKANRGRVSGRDLIMDALAIFDPHLVGDRAGTRPA